MTRFDRFLKESLTGSLVLLVIRLYLGWKWLTSGWGKLTGENPFDATGFIANAAANATGENPTVQHWWGQFLENVALPNIDVFNFLVPWGEFLVGLGLLTGSLTITAALFGLLMNYAYFLSGSIGAIPQMTLCAFFIVYAGNNASKIGVVELFKLYRSRLKSKEPVSQTTEHR